MGLIPRSGRYPGVEKGNSLETAWKLPRTEEPGGLQSIELQRVRRD